VPKRGGVKQATDQVEQYTYTHFGTMIRRILKGFSHRSVAHEVIPTMLKAGSSKVLRANYKGRIYWAD
jgi:hypothetical protein